MVKTMDSQPIDEVGIVRRKRRQRQLGKALIEHLGMTEDGIAEISGSCPESIADAMCEAFELGELKRAQDDRSAAGEENPGFCANAVCRDWVQSEGEDLIPIGGGVVEVVKTGRQSYCKPGATYACGCLFRMLEAPPNELHAESGQSLPQWAEAVRMLRRSGELEPDDNGEYNGTDFALHQNTRRLWWLLVDLLIETGRIDVAWVPDSEPLRDRLAESDAAKAILFPGN